LCCAVALCCALLACRQRKTIELTVEVRAPAYPRPRCARGPRSLGDLTYLRGRPISGAAVIVNPGALKGFTDATGKTVINGVPTGTLEIHVVAQGYRPEPGQRAEVERDRLLEVSLQPCVHPGRDQLDVGFSSTVTLRARSLCGKSWEGASYRWSQVEGPDVRASVARWDGPTLTFTTAALERVRPLPDRPQLLSFSHDQAGEYVFRLEATRADGTKSEGDVMVTSTSVASGLTSVAPLQTYYLVGEQTGQWRWTVDQHTEGWTVRLRGENTRTPSISPRPGPRARPQGFVSVREYYSGLRFALTFGQWDQVPRDCGRGNCHRSMEQNWQRGKHARSWQRMLDGELDLQRGPLADSCADCHSLGYDAHRDTHGYDDVARRLGVITPAAPHKGTYEALPQALKQVSNVYCLACHGTARVDPPFAPQPGIFTAGICARCHDRLPELAVVSQWRQSKHAKTITGKADGPDARPACAKCHTSTGFYDANFAMGRPHSPRVGVFACCTHSQPVNCQGCHNPMLPKHKRQLHLAGSVQTRSGLSLKGIGGAAVCIMCHTVDHNPTAADTLAQRRAPHAAQAEISYGKGGFVLAAPEGTPRPQGTACAAKAVQGCVTCHMDPGPLAGQPGYRKVGGHTVRMKSPKGVENISICRGCHAKIVTFNTKAKADHDGDGKIEGVQDEVDGLMRRLKRRLSAAIVRRNYRGCDAKQSQGFFFRRGYRDKIAVVDRQGIDLGDCDRSGGVERQEHHFTFPDRDLLLHKAAYNYLLVQSDRSRGLHNYAYTVALLQRTLAALKR